MASFDSLSRELRDMIYTYSLVVDVEIIPDPRLLDIYSLKEYRKTKAQYPSPGKNFQRSYTLMAPLQYTGVLRITRR